jgi:hypothetical protein
VDPDPDPDPHQNVMDPQHCPQCNSRVHKTTYASMTYTALRVMFLMWADALRGEVGPSEIAGADRRVQFWAV